MALKQEPRVTAVVTPEEKQDVQLLVLVRGSSESDVIREMTMEQIRAEAAALRLKMAA